MKCKICDSESDYLFTKKILNKYDGAYYRCRNCSFIQTEEPFWLTEAYSNAISSLDVGLISRNMTFLPIVQSIINLCFDTGKKFLDFGGGYGMFVRMMRDKGYDFYRQDKFCENLFAKEFDVENVLTEKQFELVTAFEVFEHLPYPIEGINDMLGYGKSILFSTELSPERNISSWWYLVPEAGQHVSLYHYSTLEHLAKRFNLNLYSNFSNIHLLTPKKINPMFYRLLCRYKFALFYSRLRSKPSLLQPDFEKSMASLNNAQAPRL